MIAQPLAPYSPSSLGPGTIVDFLDAHLPPAPLLIECRWCGNPDVRRGMPCRFCGVTTEPKRTHPAQCPRCGSKGRVVIEQLRDPSRGEVVFVARCHGAAVRATLSERRLEDLLEREHLFGEVARTVAEAIEGLGLTA